MPWSIDFDDPNIYYNCGSGKTDVYHYRKDISLEDLNDPKRQFKFVSSEHVTERVEGDPNVIDKLPAGVYRIEAPAFDPPYLKKIKLNDSTKLFKLDIVDQIIEDFELFLTKKEIYKELKITYKRGILLFGPPGTGKSSAIHMILSEYIKKDILVIYVNDFFAMSLVEALAKDSRVKIFVFEEISSLIGTSKQSSRLTKDMLTFLDGEKSQDNIYSIATTNYPEQLASNVIDRPGRFDKLFCLSAISEKDRNTFLKHYLKKELSTEELEVTKNLSLAYLKEVILIMFKEGKSFLETLQDINKHKEYVKTNFKYVDEKDDKKFFDEIL